MAGQPTGLRLVEQRLGMPNAIYRVQKRFGLTNIDRDFVLTRFPRGSVGAEIGVHTGDFSERILKVVRPRELHLVDPWRSMDEAPYRTSGYGGPSGFDQDRMDQIYAGVLRRFQDQIRAGTVRVHRATSADASRDLADGSLDWVYIDGNHRYDFVKADLETYRLKVKDGGLITGDDYDAPESWWQDGVTRAVDEFVAGGQCRRLALKRHQFILQNVVR